VNEHKIQPETFSLFHSVRNSQ